MSRDGAARTARALGGALDRVLTLGLAAGFAGLIGVVGLQVLARNVLRAPIIWTSDLAQLLFAWAIFLGGALAWRRRAHYHVDLAPAGRPRVSAALDLLGLAAALAVGLLLLVHGWRLAALRARADVASLGLSEAWFYAALPVSGALLLVFLAERLVAGPGPGRGDPPPRARSAEGTATGDRDGPPGASAGRASGERAAPSSAGAGPSA